MDRIRKHILHTTNNAVLPTRYERQRDEPTATFKYCKKYSQLLLFYSLSMANATKYNPIKTTKITILRNKNQRSRTCKKKKYNLKPQTCKTTLQNIAMKKYHTKMVCRLNLYHHIGTKLPHKLEYIRTKSRIYSDQIKDTNSLQK